MIETEYYTLISDYFCTDCDLSGDFKTVIQHRIQFHEHEKLIVHRKILHEVSGKKVRQELDFGYIPSDLKKNGLFIQIDEQGEDVDILMLESRDIATQTESAKFVDAAIQTEYGTQTGVIKEMYSLLPQIIEYLAEHGAIHITRLLEYMRLLASRSFPHII